MVRLATRGRDALRSDGKGIGMRILALVLCGLAAAVMSAAASAGEPIIGVGDTVEVSVSGMPDLMKRSLVDQDGLISYPLVGTLKAEGLSTAELRDRLLDLLVKGDLLKDPKIGVEMVARQPIYVSGEVMKPGAQPYAPNLTVRSAVALAGGLDPQATRGSPNVVNPADVEAQYETYALDLAKQQLRLRALEAEMARKSTISLDKLPQDLPVSPTVLAKLKDLATEELKSRLASADSEKQFLTKMVGQLQSELAAFGERRKAEEEGLRQQGEQMTKVKGLADGGIVVRGRLLEEQRSMLLMKSRFYEGIASAAQTSRLLDETSRKLQTLDEVRRQAILKEMQDVYADSAATTSKLAGTRRQLAHRQTNSPPAFVIYRRKGGAQVRVDADEDASVMPGDIVEVEFAVNPMLAWH